MYKQVPFLFVICVLLSSCVNYDLPSPKMIGGGVGGQDVQSKEMDDGKIYLITRDYLTPSKREYPFYKFYSYLIFIDKSSSTLEKRVAASEAYLCQFTSRDELERIQLNLEDLAVFYAPLKDDSSLAKLRDSTSASTFLSNYGYGYAQSLASSLDGVLDTDDFSLGIIASPQPLDMGRNGLVSDQIQMFDLTDYPPAQIGMAIKRYRELVTGDYEKREVDIILEVDAATGKPKQTEKRKIPILEPITTIDMATKIRSVFYSIGKMFTLNEAIASGDRECI